MINKKLVIFLFLLTELQIAHAASFDCRQPLLPDEKEICSSQELNDLDMEMSVKYHWLSGVLGMGARGEMSDDQQNWLQKRHKCGSDTTCLTKHYRQRINELNEIYRAINKPVSSVVGK
ncbi:hypothetical protein QF20_004437 [Salmonella enterica subsp. enterica]|nr:hypothetical protein [Salmonella enterica]EAA4188445.1 hypothetical protein [Salmonella enterica subsp. enterica serovar Mikawasima]EAC0381179.1 hypothetical protein [Salmonella enterica subsp. enterica serovar Potsdam]EBR8658009.1 hypothetical protein [Salmonella enterica subsp. enterica serovar Kottbus]EBS1713191.1 hypothetical protein [Salmonella enterica subsp. enterica serovar Vitkin]EBS5860755.1 hypothetical protein [Salmonella enterica subsp. enterica serovar Richmond]EBW5295430.1 h